MKRVVIALAIIALACAMVLGGLLWHDHRVHAEYRHAARAEMREETRNLIRFCDLHGFATKIEMGTANFPRYFATEPVKAKQVLHDIVNPVIDAQQLACGGAKTDIELLQDGADEPDRFIDRALPEVLANLGTLARVRVASEALDAALAAPDSNVWTEKLTALRAAAGGR